MSDRERLAQVVNNAYRRYNANEFAHKLVADLIAAGVTLPPKPPAPPPLVTMAMSEHAWNVTPSFINSWGTWQSRPESTKKIENARDNLVAKAAIQTKIEAATDRAGFIRLVTPGGHDYGKVFNEAVLALFPGLALAGGAEGTEVGSTPTRGAVMQYRKKPVVIEAFQMTEARRNDNSDWPEWLHRAWNTEGEGSLFIDADDPERQRLAIGTLEGIHRVQWGDWIIRGVKGELYPCKPDIFEATYEPA